MSADPSAIVYLLAALPLALNVLVHGAGIHLALRYEVRLEKRNLRRGAHVVANLVIYAMIALLLMLHALEIIIWGVYFWLGGSHVSLSDAVTFAATAYTTLGSSNPSPTWQQLASLVAIVGMLMFGWSTGALVWLVGRVWTKVFPIERPPSPAAPTAPSGGRAASAPDRS